MTNLTLTPLTPSPLGVEPQAVSQYRTHKFIFNESEGNQAQTWTVPVGATVLGWTGWNTNGAWGSGADDPFFCMGDQTQPVGYADTLDLSGLQDFNPTLDTNFWSGYTNFGTYAGIQEFYAPSPGVSYPNGGTITATVSTVTPDGVGVFNIRVFYLVDAPGDTTDPDLPERTLTTRVSSAQILALADTPVEIIPAPGAGLVAMPVSVIPVTKNGVVPYTISANVKLGPLGVSTTNMQSIPAVLGNGPTGLFAGESYVYSILPTFNDQADWNNQPILLQIDENPTLGEFDLLLTVQYMIVPVT